jgi:hypothetical protein
MKTAIIMLSVVSFFISAGAVTARADDGEGTLTAQVDSVTIAQVEGEYSSIAVINEYGVSVIFEVTSTTTLYGADRKPITMDALNKDASVTVKGAMVKEGNGIATSIRLLK